MTILNNMSLIKWPELAWQVNLWLGGHRILLISVPSIYQPEAITGTKSAWTRSGEIFLKDGREVWNLETEQGSSPWWLSVVTNRSKRKGKLSHRTAVRAARNIRSSTFRSPSHAQPSSRPSAWTPGLSTWTSKSQLSHIPKSFLFHVLILNLFCK